MRGAEQVLGVLMSEIINRVLVDRVQSFTTAQQKTGRENIGAVGTGDLTAYVNYSALSKDADSSITAINGSAVGMTGVSTKSNLSGIGTTGQPLDLNTSVILVSGTSSINIDPSKVQLTSQGYTERFSADYKVGGYGYTSQQRSNTSQSATVSLNTSHLIIEKSTADGHYSATYSTGGTFYSITGTASPSSVDDRTSLWLGNRGVASFRGQSWSPGYNHTGFRLVGQSGNEDTVDNPRLELVNPPVGSATVDIPSVIKWNSYSSSKLDASASSSFITSTAGLATTGDLSAKLDASASSSFITSTAGLQPSGNYLTSVSSNNNITGNGTSGSKLDLNTSVTLTATEFPYYNYVLNIKPSSISLSDSAFGTAYANLGEFRVEDTAGRFADMKSNRVEISDGSGNYTSKGVSSIRYVPAQGASELYYTGIGEYVDNDNPRTLYHIGTSAQQVDYSSIERWNGYSAKLDSVSAKSNLSGIGTTAQPLDLNTSVTLVSGTSSINIDPSKVQLTSQGYTERFSADYKVGGYGYTSQQRSNTSQSATVDLNTSRLTFEKNTADGHYSATYSTGGTFFSITGTASPSSVNDRTSLWLGNRGVASFRGQSWSTNHTGFRLVGESGNEDTVDNPRLELAIGTNSAVVDISSIKKWNALYTAFTSYTSTHP